MNFSSARIVSILVGFTAACSVNSANASDWGCEVLLCLANPQGPTAVAQCVPPIKKLWRELAKGKAFPRCNLVGSAGSQSYARQNVNYYAPCPAGLVPLPSGAFVDTGAGLLRGFGNGDGLMPGNVRDGERLSRMACVGNQTGTKSVRVGDSWQDSYEVSVSLYDRIVYQDPSTSGNVIDVYVDGRLINRVSY